MARRSNSDRKVIDMNRWCAGIGAGALTTAAGFLLLASCDADAVSSRPKAIETEMVRPAGTRAPASVQGSVLPPTEKPGHDSGGTAESKIATGGPTKKGPSVPNPRVRIEGIQTSEVTFNASALSKCVDFVGLIAAPQPPEGNEVIGRPFLLDGRAVLHTEEEVQKFLDQLKKKRAEGGPQTFVLSILAAPRGTAQSSMEEWFGKCVTTDRGVALTKHVASLNGSLVLVTLARGRGDSVVTDEALIGVAIDQSTNSARIVGFVD